MVPFESLGKVSYSHSIVSGGRLAVSCIVCSCLRYSEILVENGDFFHTPLHLTPSLAPRRNIAITFSKEKLEWCAYT